MSQIRATPRSVLQSKRPLPETMEGSIDGYFFERANKKFKKAEGRHTTLPSLKELVLEAYLQKGALGEDISWLSTLCSTETLARYHSAWKNFMIMATEKGWLLPFAKDMVLQLASCPSRRLAAWIAAFAKQFSISQTRNIYSAFLLIPSTQTIRFEPTLRALKSQWNQAIPKYDTFYRVDFLLQVLLNKPPPIGEGQVREHLILILRFQCLFRGIDLE